MSQFASLFKTDGKEKTDAKKKTETKPKTKAEKKKPENASLYPAPTAAAKSVEPITPKPAPKLETKKRESGKSSNADYTQVLTYIRRETHKAVKRALLDDEQERNLSDLVEELLAGWLKKQKTERP
jgi:outer membrane biosynthesis protein TonB